MKIFIIIYIFNHKKLYFYKFLLKNKYNFYYTRFCYNIYYIYNEFIKILLPSWMDFFKHFVIYIYTTKKIKKNMTNDFKKKNEKTY